MSGAVPITPYEPYEPAELRRRMHEQVPMSPDRGDSAWRLVVTVAGFAAGFVLVATGGPIAAVAGVVVLAFMYSSLIYAEHELLHRSVFRTGWLNDALGLLVGTAVLAPYGGHRVYHLQHHARTHAEGDAEPVVVLRSSWMWVGAMLAGTHGLRYDAFAWIPRGLTSRNRTSRALTWASVAWLVAAVAFGAFMATAHTRMFLLGWLVPILIGSPISTFLTLSDHYGCEYGPADAFVTTRSIVGNRFTRFLAWNSNYHAEHHWAPSVPTAHLAKLHELALPHLAHPETSYVRFHRELLRGIRNGDVPAVPPWRA